MRLVPRTFLVASFALFALFISPPTAAVAFPIGLAWADGALWIADVRNGSISRVDPWTNTVLSSFTPFADVYAGTPFGNNRIRDLAWDGSILWAAYWTDPMLAETNPGDINMLPSRIYGFDPSDGSVVSSFAAPFAGHPDGLEWNGTHLLVGEEGGSFLPTGRIFSVDPITGLPVASFSVPFNPASFNPRGLAWDGSAIWAAYQSLPSDQLKRHDPLTGEVLKSFSYPGGCYLGLAFDGAALWAAGCLDGAGTVYQIDTASGTVLHSFVPQTSEPVPAPAPAPVPEPASLLLLGSGIVGIVAKARKRRKQAASTN